MLVLLVYGIIGVLDPNFVKGHNFLMLNSTVNNSYGPVNGNLIEISIDDSDSFSKLITPEFVKSVLRLNRGEERERSQNDGILHDVPYEGKKVFREHLRPSVSLATEARPPSSMKVFPTTERVVQIPDENEIRVDLGIKNKAESADENQIESLSIDEVKRARMMFNAGDISLLKNLAKNCLKDAEKYSEYFSPRKVESILIRLNSKVLSNLVPLNGDPDVEKKFIFMVYVREVMADSSTDFDDVCMANPVTELMQDIVLKIERAVKALFRSERLTRSRSRHTRSIRNEEDDEEYYSSLIRKGIYLKYPEFRKTGKIMQKMSSGIVMKTLNSSDYTEVLNSTDKLILTQHMGYSKYDFEIRAYNNTGMRNNLYSLQMNPFTYSEYGKSIRMGLFLSNSLKICENKTLLSYFGNCLNSVSQYKIENGKICLLRRVCPKGQVLSNVEHSCVQSSHHCEAFKSVSNLSFRSYVGSNSEVETSLKLNVSETPSASLQKLLDSNSSSFENVSLRKALKCHSKPQKKYGPLRLTGLVNGTILLSDSQIIGLRPSINYSDGFHYSCEFGSCEAPASCSGDSFYCSYKDTKCNPLSSYPCNVLDSVSTYSIDSVKVLWTMKIWGSFEECEEEKVSSGAFDGKPNTKGEPNCETRVACESSLVKVSSSCKYNKMIVELGNFMKLESYPQGVSVSSMDLDMSTNQATSRYEVSLFRDSTLVADHIQGFCDDYSICERIDCFLCFKRLAIISCWTASIKAAFSLAVVGVFLTFTGVALKFLMSGRKIAYKRGASLKNAVKRLNFFSHAKGNRRSKSDTIAGEGNLQSTVVDIERAGEE